MPNGAGVPGSLAVFADSISQTSDAGGTTLHLAFNSYLAAGGFHPAGPGDTSNDLWFGGDVENHFDFSASANAILVGGASWDVLTGGNGGDFIDGAGHNDTLTGGRGNDILRGGPGNDALYGGEGNDTYLFNRGDGADTVIDHLTVTRTRARSQRSANRSRRAGARKRTSEWHRTTRAAASMSCGRSKLA